MYNVVSGTVIEYHAWLTGLAIENSKMKKSPFPHGSHSVTDERGVEPRLSNRYL